MGCLPTLVTERQGWLAWMDGETETLESFYPAAVREPTRQDGWPFFTSFPLSKTATCFLCHRPECPLSLQCSAGDSHFSCILCLTGDYYHVLGTGQAPTTISTVAEPGTAYSVICAVGGTEALALCCVSHVVLCLLCS